MDEELQQILEAKGITREGGAKKKSRKKPIEEIEAAKRKMTPDELEAAHKKFMYIMFGLFAVVLIFMIIFNGHFDFMSDGGI